MTEAEHLPERLALDLMCRSDTLTAKRLARVSPEDWERITGWAFEHRFASYLHYSLAQAGHLGSLPAETADLLGKASRRASMKALSMLRDMVRISQLLDAAGVAHMFMKGAYLAQFAYPDIGLRPMRDLDLLVRPEQAMVAFSALQAGGLKRIARYNGNPEAFLAASKHLPPIRTAQGTNVEIHVLMTAPSEFLRNDVSQWRFDALKPRMISRTVAGTPISFPGPEDQLLHLCVHSAIDHQFNNGPLILSDVVWFLRTHAVDWTTLWQLAETQGASRGLALVLRLVEQEWPGQEIGWVGESGTILSEGAPILSVARLGLFRSFEARGDVALQAELAASPGMKQKAAELMSRILPPPAKLSKEVPAAADSLWIYAYYPVKWLRLCRRLWQFGRSRFDERARADAGNLGQISAWLRG